MTINLIRIIFPDIPLKTRDGHKLRGFFGNLFQRYSPILHNHFDDGSLRYAYPLVQYKVLDGIANLIGIQQGAELLKDLFLKISFLDIDGKKFQVFSKHIQSYQIELVETDKIFNYKFITPWLALNQKNYQIYKNGSNYDKISILRKILVGNILSFYKNFKFFIQKKLDLTLNVNAIQTNFKNQRMLAFFGQFSVNAILPDFIGLGKAVSRGFGTIMKLD